MAAGELTAAEAHYRRALTIQNSAPGVEAEDVRQTLAGLAEVLRQTERATEASELEARARALGTVPAGDGWPSLP